MWLPAVLTKVTESPTLTVKLFGEKLIPWVLTVWFVANNRQEVINAEINK